MKLNEQIQGFAVREIRFLPELDARLYRMEHIRSGARLVWLDRQDENKTFGIAFRTLPEDDTGVFHILEHSVLCGSDRYPVKEPFVELMKSSLQTFLNAMTFPDKTFYPVSSRNEKDFVNLLRVYMDAVLHPAIYRRPEIFRQEGWHYELADHQEAPVYKGVVYNEMKGAFASPDTRLQWEVNRLLFPDTCYRFESGGHPAHIPELTYEQFLESHRRFYHPSNSYLFLDGRLDIGAILTILDEEYLNAYTRMDKLPEFTLQAPVRGSLSKVFYEISPKELTENRAWLAWGCVLGDYACQEERMGMRVLADVLCGGNEAPLKRRLLSAGLAQDIRMRVIDGILQPYVLLETVNIDESRSDEVGTAVRSELERLARDGLEHSQVAATLANLEFQLRERDYGGMPQGLGFGMDVLSSWTYGGDPAANLEVEGLFASLNRKLDEGWFEALIESLLLKNSHSCQVLLAPSATLGEEERKDEALRLHAAERNWSAEEKACLWTQQKELDAWQASEDTPESLASLPMLSLADIPAEPENIPLKEGTVKGIPLLHHNIPTGGIGYVNLYFDISDLTPRELSLASLLGDLLRNLDTEKHKAGELKKLLRTLTGTVRIQMEPYGRVNEPEDCRTFLCIFFSALEAKMGQAAALVSEILTATRFEDKGRLHELVRQIGVQMEQGISFSGHSFAMTRILAGNSAEGTVREYSDGISCYQWIKALEKDFTDSADSLVKDLQALCARIFTTGRLTVSITAGTGTFAVASLALEKELCLLETERRELPCAVTPWGMRREGIIIPADISFAAMGGNLLAQGASYSGKQQVAGRVASLAYLWNAVRVQGGAYGTGLALGETGSACFYSYRDPDAARTIGCYRKTADFLRQFSNERQDLTGFIIGAVAEADPLLTSRMRGKIADIHYWRQISWKDLCQIRQEMLSMVPEDLAEFAQSVEKLMEESSVCVVGSRKQVEACTGLDTVIML